MALDSSLYSSMVWFSHVAQHGGFTKAANHLGGTRAALSQHVKSLEEQLGNMRLSQLVSTKSLLT